MAIWGVCTKCAAEFELDASYSLAYSFICCYLLYSFIAFMFIKKINLQFSNFSFLTDWYPEYPGFVE